VNNQVAKRAMYGNDPEPALQIGKHPYEHVITSLYVGEMKAGSKGCAMGEQLIS